MRKSRKSRKKIKGESCIGCVEKITDGAENYEKSTRRIRGGADGDLKEKLNPFTNKKLIIRSQQKCETTEKIDGHSSQRFDDDMAGEFTH